MNISTDVPAFSRDNEDWPSLSDAELREWVGELVRSVRTLRETNRVITSELNSHEARLEILSEKYTNDKSWRYE